MRSAIAILLALTFLPTCRSTRDTVNIMDPNAPPNPPSEDVQRIDGSVKTSIKISALSLPMQAKGFERLDLSIRRAETTEEKYRAKDYKVGELIPIEAHQKYDIILGAWMGGTEIYSTRFCTTKQTFLAEEGVNLFTASLCGKP